MTGSRIRAARAATQNRRAQPAVTCWPGWRKNGQRTGQRGAANDLRRADPELNNPTAIKRIYLRSSSSMLKAVTSGMLVVSKGVGGSWRCHQPDLAGFELACKIRHV